ncbi:MAG TPA: universal stress protein [Stellaceae bacterium]|nr:universal stress protein [Stellaceae bacterium]
MKTILVLSGGGDTDRVVFGTALSLARAFGAHLEFLHIRPGPGDAAAFTPHVGFARGAALRAALDHLEAEANRRSAASARHFQEFCAQEAIEIADAPARSRGLSAAWQEARGDAVEYLVRRARHNDLAVLARPSRPNGMPPDLSERLLLGCGRPVLVAPARLRPSIAGTALVCWNETAAAARALGAALPLLSKSERVVIAGVEEAARPAASADGLRDLARQLSWHGIRADIRWLSAAACSAAEQLELAAADYDADLLVMGGYGRSPARETIFGGCTRHFLARAERPVLMMH